LGKPGVVDSPEIRKRAISTKLTSYNNIAGGSKTESAVKSTSTLETQPETPQTISDFEPMKITYEDVVTGGNSVYGSQFPFSNGGIVFAIGQGVPSTSHMSAGDSLLILLSVYIIVIFNFYFKSSPATCVPSILIV
jgi:hypothetical protein